MNHCVPNWNLEEVDFRNFPDLFNAANQKNHHEPNCGVVELLWHNGQVVLNNQTNRKSILASIESQQAHHKPNQPSKFCDNSFGNSTKTIQEDETASWLQYPLDDSFENEFCSDFFQENTIPESQVTDSIPTSSCPGDGGLINFPKISRPIKTLESSNCKSNQEGNDTDLSRVSCGDGAVKEDVQKMLIQSGRGQMNTIEPTATSSSGGSGGNLGRIVEQSNSHQSQKRKGRDGDESECQSEVNEYESVEAKKPLRRSASARRSRAAEVHNLSERKRRDRINEKMKALKELIPNCNKTDKASMLDEAIEYLKSLQLQLQMMWMGRGMVPMMVPGIQHYMPCMGVDQTSLPQIHSPAAPRDPLVDQSITSPPATNYLPICPSTSFNPVNFQTHIHMANPPEPYAGYLGFHNMQRAPQGMNLFQYGRSSSSSGHCSGEGLPAKNQKGK